MAERREGTWLVTRWTGEIDSDNAQEVERRTLGQIGELSTTDAGLTIDMSGVTYVDSAGIRILAVINQLLSQRGQGLTLVVPERSVLARALEVGGISSLIPTFASLSAARRSR